MGCETIYANLQLVRLAFTPQDPLNNKVQSICYSLAALLENGNQILLETDHRPFDILTRFHQGLRVIGGRRQNAVTSLGRNVRA